MTALTIDGVSKRFGSVTALNLIELSVRTGEFLCLLGPTNAGKSTLLKTVAGLHVPDEGRILIHGRDVTAFQPRARNLSLLFQNVALFPNLSGFTNIAFPLRKRGIAEQKVRDRVYEVAELLGITHLLDRRPGSYSGGERQRVAIGRAIAQPSEILLLDEPLSNLDAQLRLDLRMEFRRLHRTLGRTIIYVTHDHIEALSLADRIAVLHEGRLRQVDTPERLYDMPADRFVAEFIGSPPMNLIPARLCSLDRGAKLIVAEDLVLDPPHGIEATMDPERQVLIGVRPEAVLFELQRTSETPFEVRVRWIEHLGSRSVVHADLGGTIVKAVVTEDPKVMQNGRAWIGFQPQLQTLYNAEPLESASSKPLPINTFCADSSSARN